MRRRSRLRKRRGATLAESAVVLMAFLILVLGMLDLGIGVFHYHIISQAARQLARKAIVHGNANGIPANQLLGEWGPTTYGPVTVGPSNTDAIAQAIQPSLACLDSNQVTVSVQWPDSSNAPENRVEVQVSTTYTPIMTFIFGNATIPLSAGSTMLITH